jgi:hypothetical protein
LRRIARWRRPPNWSRVDWEQEVRAHASLVTCLAGVDYDPCRGVPFVAFVYHRVLAGVLTRYRQEWTFAMRCSHVMGPNFPARNGGVAPQSHAVDELVDYIRIILPQADRALLLSLFWQNRSEASIGRDLGISQQAVSKRKRVVLHNLRRTFA